MICWKCKKEINIDSIGRSTECPLCGADLHSCKMCRHYESGAHYDCKETVQDVVVEKERANFCDFFQVNSNISAGGGSSKAQDAKKAFTSLFGD